MNFKENYKKRILQWLGENGIFPKKTRLYETRYGLEVRVYLKPMEYLSSRSSFRRTEKVIDEVDNEGRPSKFHYRGTRGRHEIKIPMYIHINEQEYKKEEERDYIIMMLKDYITDKEYFYES